MQARPASGYFSTLVRTLPTGDAHYVRVMRSILVFAIAACLVESPALAQSPRQEPASTRHVFLEAAVAADSDDTDFTAVGPVRSFAAGVGAEISRRYSVRIEVELPDWHRDDDGGGGSATAYEHHWATRTRTLAMMVARHMGERYRLTLLAGVSAMAHDVSFSGFFDRLGTNGAVVEHTDLNDRYTEYWPGLSLGIDATLRLTSALALVPQIRVARGMANELGDILSSGVSRPRIALRWTF